MSRVQAWGYSFFVHGLTVAAAVWLVSELRPVTPREPFRWEVSIVEPPTAAPVQEAKPAPPARVAAKVPPPQSVHSIVEVQKRDVAPAPPIETRTVVQSRPAPVERAPDAPMTREVKTASKDQPVEKATQSAPIEKTGEQVEKVVAHEPAAVSSPQAVLQERITSVAEYSPVRREAPSVQSAPVQEVKVQPHVAPPVESGTPSSMPQPRQPESTPEPQPVQSPAAKTVPIRSGPAVRADFGWLKDLLARRIKEVKRYPHMARLNHLEGKVVVHAVIMEDGNLADLRIHESSGHEVLDEDALETMRKACPLHLSHPLGRAQMAIRIPINYSLND
jgi:protein TonB